MFDALAIVTKDFKTPIEEVWHALIDPKIVAKYFFGTQVSGEFKVGGDLTFSGEWQGKPYFDKGIVKELVPPHKLSYIFHSSFSNLPDEPENYALISYELSETKGITTLVITQESQNIQTAETSEKNWKIILDNMEKVLKES
jgi:uncharacterized protein YndB with AHSA1/START domain